MSFIRLTSIHKITMLQNNYIPRMQDIPNIKRMKKGDGLGPVGL